MRARPRFKELIVRRIPDPATRTAGLRSGEIDIGQTPPDREDYCTTCPAQAISSFIGKGRTRKTNKTFTVYGSPPGDEPVIGWQRAFQDSPGRPC